jgi:hypothetical protein
MRSQPYVRFIADDPEIVQQITRITRRVEDPFELEDLSRVLGLGDLDRSQLDYWSVVRERVGPWRECGLNADNHSHSFDLGVKGHSLTADAWRPSCIVADMLLYAYLRNTKHISIELISNVYVDKRMSPLISSAVKSRVASELLIRRIASVYSEAGPDVAGVLELRDSPYVREFRDFIANCAETTKDPSVPSLVQEIESQFAKHTTDVVLKRHREAGVSRSISRVILTNCLDYIIPGLSDALDLVDNAETRRANWAAFLTESSMVVK